jgi:hypothetical protein
LVSGLFSRKSTGYARIRTLHILGKVILSTHPTLPILVALVSSILARVRVLVVEGLREMVISGGKECAQAGADPVDPVVAGEGACSYGRAEGASWV